VSRRLALVLVPLVAIGAAAAPSVAAPKPKPKPITQTYEVGPLTPDPTPIAGDICDPVTPTAIDAREITIPAAGTLKVDIDFVGDWALGLRDAKGNRLAESDGGTPETDESMQVKFKKAGKATIEACNFAGGPTATVTWTFTYK
jgi:hypothetical protein